MWLLQGILSYGGGGETVLAIESKKEKQAKICVIGLPMLAHEQELFIDVLVRSCLLAVL